MIIDTFIASTGGISSDMDEAAEVHISMLAEEFLRAGGRIEWSDWRGWSQETRDAFVGAGSRIDAERAHAAALAIIRVQARPPADVVQAAVPVAP